jgi:shikimate kinase
MDTRLIRTPALYLVGFMGCGKTTVGAALAYELGWRFYDLDRDIENAAGSSITQVFEWEGEPAFRRREHEALARRIRAAQHGYPMVVALGGGAFAQTENVELIRDNGITLWLDAPFELVRQRVAGQTHRPLAVNPEKFAALYEARRASYVAADYRVAVEGNDAKATVEAILNLPIFD